MADIRAKALGLDFSLFTSKSVFRSPVGTVTEKGLNVAVSRRNKWAVGFRLIPKHSAPWPGVNRENDPLIFFGQKNGFYLLQGQCMDRGFRG